MSNIIFVPWTVSACRNAISRKIASVFSRLYKNHSRHERFVQSRAIWVLSRIDSLYPRPDALLLSPFLGYEERASTVVSVFLRAAMSATSLRGTDKIDFSLSFAKRHRCRLQRQRRRVRGDRRRRRRRRWGRGGGGIKYPRAPPRRFRLLQLFSHLSFLF